MRGARQASAALAGREAVTWLTRLRVEEAGHDLSGRAVWELLEPLAYRSRRFGDIVVPAGFRTNFVSVPRRPVIFMLAGDRAHKEATLHDWPYTVHNMRREDADALFLEVLLADPLISGGLANTMYTAVRWFGQSSWDDDSNILQLPEIRQLVVHAP